MNETVYEFAREVYHMFPNWFWMGTALIGMICLWLICLCIGGIVIMICERKEDEENGIQF